MHTKNDNIFSVEAPFFVFSHVESDIVFYFGAIATICDGRNMKKNTFSSPPMAEMNP